MRTTRPFADSAALYRAAGWAGTLPLPPGAKWPPPDGFTGNDGAYPNDATVAYWAANGQAEGNIGLRMPAESIGLDVDDYGGRTGGAVLTELAGRIGPLPRTWRSSARPFPSGILMYRVPPGAMFIGALPGGVEIIQRHHRYAVVEPSIHPSGAPYRWYAPDGTLAGRPPRVDELPALPAPWVTYLSERHRAPAVPGGEFWQAPKTIETAQAQWARLAERFVGFVRRCEWFGWGGDAHGQLLELTREVAQLAPAHAHRAVGEWFAAGGASFVDPRVRQMLDSALGKYPADKIVAPAQPDSIRAAAGGMPPGPVAGATMGSHARLAPSVESTSQTAAPGGDASSVAASGTPRRLPMIGDPVWDAYGWTRSVRAMARSADVCPDAVLGACLATYAARVPPGVRIVTGTKMPLGANLVTALVGPSGSDKSTAFNLAQRMMPGSAVPIVNNPGSGEAFAASFVHPDPDAEGAVGKRPKVLKPDPRVLFYVAEGAMLGAIGARLGSTWLPHLRSLAVDESLSTTNATAEINRTVPAQRYRAGVVIGFQVTTAMPVLHDTSTGTAQRFLWFTSLSSEPRGLPAEAPHVPMAVPVVTRLAAGIDDTNEPIHYLAVTRSITERIVSEQEHTRLTRDITSSDDHDAHRHTLVAKLAALAVLADGRVMIDEHDWLWAEALYAASAATRDVLLDIAEDRARTEQLEHGQRMGAVDRARKQFDSDETRVAEVVMRRAQKVGPATRRRLRDAVESRDRHLFAGAFELLTKHGWLVDDGSGKFHAGSRNTDQ